MNKIRVLRNIIGKLICFGVFGLFGYLIAALFFPLINIYYKTDVSRQRAKISILKASFAIFLVLLRIFARYKIDTSQLLSLSTLQSHVVVVNHPSLIDIIFLISALPNPDCIVKQALFSNFWLKGIVKSLFISSSDNFDTVIERCRVSLENHNNIIIFPEGSRTPSGEKMSLPLKRGFAHIALRTKRNILPLHIKTHNYAGLAKHDSIFKVHTQGYSVFTVIPKTQIDIVPFLQHNISTSARKITHLIEKNIFYEDDFKEAL